jgi:hypothetical protein
MGVDVDRANLGISTETISLKVNCRWLLAARSGNNILSWALFLPA